LSIVVRRYESRDEDRVLLLMEKHASWDATPTRADVQGFSSTSPELFFVADVKGQVVGFIYGSESKHLPNETLMKWGATRVASIETLAVDETHRRRGIGTSLITKFLKTAKSKGVDLVTLSVPTEELEARKLYAKLGFEERAYFLRKRL